MVKACISDHSRSRFVLNLKTSLNTSTADLLQDNEYYSFRITFNLILVYRLIFQYIVLCFIILSYYIIQTKSHSFRSIQERISNPSDYFVFLLKRFETNFNYNLFYFSSVFSVQVFFFFYIYIRFRTTASTVQSLTFQETSLVLNKLCLRFAYSRFIE